MSGNAAIAAPARFAGEWCRRSKIALGTDAPPNANNSPTSVSAETQHAIVRYTTSHHLDIHMSTETHLHDLNRVMPGDRQQFGDERRQTSSTRNLTQRQITFPDGGGRVVQRLVNIGDLELRERGDDLIRDEVVTQRQPTLSNRRSCVLQGLADVVDIELRELVDDLFRRLTLRHERHHRGHGNAVPAMHGSPPVIR